MLSIAFLRRHWPLLAYGWLMTFFSGFGQTYFVSIFGGAIRADLDLSHTLYGTCYSAGTLVSAFTLAWVGRLIDRWSLLRFSLVVIIGLSLATGLVAIAGGVVGLAIAFFATRLFGQGLMIHAAMTTMGRHFSAERGRAVAFALTGHVAGGATLPVATVTLLAFTHWRNVWLIGGATLLLITAPAAAYLLRQARQRVDAIAARPAETTSGSAEPGNSNASAPPSAQDWTLSEVIREPGLYPRLAVLLAPAFITTGLIFHQVHLGAQKGWGLELIAVALSAYALGSFVMTLVTGPLVDRLSARRLLPLSLTPMALACVLLAWVTSESGALLFFGFLGFGTGLTQVLMGAIWAELYGARHLGAIRAFAASSSVLSSALAPGVVGVLIDRGWGVDVIALACAGYCLAASVFAALAQGVPVKPQPARSRQG